MSTCSWSYHINTKFCSFVVDNCMVLGDKFALNLTSRYC